MFIEFSVGLRKRCWNLSGTFFKDLFCVWSTNITELHCVRGTMLFTVGDTVMKPIRSCSGPSTCYLRVSLNIKCCHFHFSTEEIAPQTGHVNSSRNHLGRHVLEMQTPRPHPAQLNQNLHFDKFPRGSMWVQSKKPC